MKKEKTAAERRKELAIMWICQSRLYCSGILTQVEDREMFNRILAYQDKYKIAITKEQLDSVEIKYDDEP